MQGRLHDDTVQAYAPSPLRTSSSATTGALLRG